MYRITFVLDLFKGPQEQPLSHATLQVMLNALMHADMLYLLKNPAAPRLYDSGVRYEEEPPGQEDWQDVPTCLRLGVGDCLPLTMLVMRSDWQQVPLGLICPGDRILGDEGFTTVRECATTGAKSILKFFLKNGKVLRSSLEHRIFLQDGDEIRAKDIRVGMKLKGLSRFFEGPEVVGIETSAAELCGDITTDTGKFYLPESDVVVHNCEDLACWRAAELRVRENVKAKPTFIWKIRPNGGYLYHIQVKYPDGRIEDPSRRLGMR